MRSAFFNCFAGRQVAETELARRLCLAARSLGWDAREVASSTEVRAFAPDLVLALHFFTPKLTGHPTYGCLWNPPAFVESDPRYVRNVLSYDGYLSSSPAMTAWIEGRLAGLPKKRFVAPFYPSCNRTPYHPPDLERPRLAYAGTNWDGTRRGELFARLDSSGWLDVYGPAEGWRHVRASYRGALPFDGTSLLGALHRAGVGLCLHHAEHRAAGTPSLRVFEIAAAGAVTICEEHPFVREAFGDAVLYLDPSLDAAGLADQIGAHLRWIASHRDAARAMAREAHGIFERRFTLEALLERVAEEHGRLAEAKGFLPRARTPAPAPPRVQLVVRAGARSARTLRRALDSVVAQTAPGVGAILVRYEDVDLEPVLRAYAGSLPLQLVEGERGGLRSTHLWQGLRAVTAEHFGVLDDDDALHPNHVASLLALLDADPGAGVAYAAAIRVWEPGGNGDAPPPAEPAELAYGEPFDAGKLFALDNYIASNAFLARTVLLADLPGDPRLPVLEDLLLLLALAVRGRFVYGHDATCEFYWRTGAADNSVLGDRAPWAAAARRVAQLAWSDGLVAPGAVAQRARHEEALRSAGPRLLDDRARLVEDRARLEAERERWKDECALRDGAIRDMTATRGWRALAAWREAKRRVRSVAAKVRGGAGTR